MGIIGTTLCGVLMYHEVLTPAQIVCVIMIDLRNRGVEAAGNPTILNAKSPTGFQTSRTFHIVMKFILLPIFGALPVLPDRAVSREQ